MGRNTTVRALVTGVLWVIGTAGAWAADAIRPGELLIDPPTLECLGFRWYVEGDDDGDAGVTTEYRKVGESAWRPALPLLRVQREVVNRDFEAYTCDNLFAGSILSLQPQTAYEVKLTLVDPDGGGTERTLRATTRGEPVAPAPARTLHLYPAGWKGARAGRAFDTLAAAVAALRPGDLLLVHRGVHRVGPEAVRIAVKATAARPVVLRAAGDGEAILDGGNAKRVIDFSGSEHLFFEGLHIRKAGTVFFADTEHGAHWVTIRRCRLTDIVTGIYSYSNQATNWFIADNEMRGINPAWYPRPQGTYMEPAHSGVKIYGRGHVICHNRVGKFGDCLAIANYGPPPADRALQCVAIDIYENDLFQAKDDGIEADYGCHNIRIYRNRIVNAHTALSAQPTYGGPIYYIRNMAYGITALNLKLHNWCSGLEIYHNTLVTAGQAFRSYNRWQNGTLRNNLLLGATGYCIDTGSPHPRTTLDYNGYRVAREDGGPRFKWYDGKEDAHYAELADFRRATGFERHGLMLDFDSFVRAGAPRPGATYRSTEFDLALKSSSLAVDAGQVLPTVNDGYTGKAPDLGCYERGQPTPAYGPRPARS